MIVSGMSLVGVIRLLLVFVGIVGLTRAALAMVVAHDLQLCLAHRAAVSGACFWWTRARIKETGRALTMEMKGRWGRRDEGQGEMTE